MCKTFGTSMAILSAALICVTRVEANQNAEDVATYPTRYDDVDLDEILRSERLLANYVSCLLGNGHCTADGNELKQNLPDAINNDCKKCSEKQKTGSERVMHYIIDNKPEWWNELEKQYNPTGTYKKAYMEKMIKLQSENEHDQGNEDN